MLVQASKHGLGALQLSSLILSLCCLILEWLRAEGFRFSLGFRVYGLGFKVAQKIWSRAMRA